MLSNLLFSNYPPAKLTGKSFQSFFGEAIENTTHLRIATGYISTAALAELKKIVADNGRPHVELLIGMHYFDGFTRTQHQAACDLAQLLKNAGLGSVSLATTFRFHGKMYTFSEKDIPFASVIGSSNFSGVIKSSERIYETDIVLYEPTIKEQIHQNILKLKDSIGEDILTVRDIKYVEYNSLLANHDGVSLCEPSESIKWFAKPGRHTFNIPIKATEAPKSSLNVFFGKGRENQRGFVLPRPWYEAELIVPKEITSQQGYPTNSEFTVYTDDGWKFGCKTSGDFSKNFRSLNDLQILGRWMKGRLEQSGALRVGEQVTDEVLRKYGRNNFSLSSTTDPTVWLLDFKV